MKGMLSLYDFDDYREYMKAWIEQNKRTQKGLQSKLAAAAGISSSLISFILKGDKHLSLEHAAEIADYMGLTENETDYFYLLVECGRAGSTKLRRQLQKRIETQRKQLSKRIPKNTDLSDEVKAIYYSSWTYSGLRNLTATPGPHDVQSLSRRLGLNPMITGGLVDFLLQNGLCRRDEAGGLTYGPQRTHIGADSPFVNKHHQNWRIKGLQTMEQRKDSNLFFTGPMSLSEEAAEEVRRLLPKMIEQVMAITGPSDSEKVCCLNMDWFEY